jgi:hypothetical protein
VTALGAAKDSFASLQAQSRREKAAIPAESHNLFRRLSERRSETVVIDDPRTRQLVANNYVKT